MTARHDAEQRGAPWRQGSLLWGAFCLLAAAWQPASGEAADDPRYPTRPVRWIVPFPVGGSIDIVARIVGQKLYDSWRQQVVVDNRPGAGGRLGTQIGAAAVPDGYTQTLTLNTALTSDNILSRKSELDLQRAFAPITIVAATSQLLVANPSVPARNLQEFIALAKSQPGRLNYGSSGPGGSLHLAMELLKSMTGIDIVHVPYQGGPLAVNDVLSGQLAVMFFNAPAALPFVKSGKLRALGVSTAQRSLLLPDVPTIAEVGVAGFDTSVWYGLLAPAGTPQAIISKVHRDITAVLQVAEIRKFLLNIGAEPVGNSPQEFAGRVKAETAKWTKIIDSAKIRLE